jgi:hypothetical protein
VTKSSTETELKQHSKLDHEVKVTYFLMLRHFTGRYTQIYMSVFHWNIKYLNRSDYEKCIKRY